MASYKNVQKERKKKTSHFSSSTERMTGLTTPHHPPTEDLQHPQSSAILSVKPNQAPRERDPSESSQSSLSSQLQIPTEALSKLQEIIEAQKVFLKYQEMKEILQSRESNRVEAEREAVREASSASLSGRSDSDKENSQASKRRKKTAVPEEGSMLAARTNKTSQTTQTGQISQPSAISPPPSVPPLTLGVTEASEATCDWAYWYQPTTGTVRPAKVTIRSRPAPVGGARVRSQSRDEKPWRSGMKKAEPVAVSVSQEKIPEKSEPVKPWRTNMRKEPKPAEPVVVPAKPKTEERAWRNNMKKVQQSQKVTSEAPVRKRNYDRREVRQFIKDKKLRQREEIEEKEKQENLRKEVVKRRLQELDKLQKQIAEADVREFRHLSQSEKNLTEAGQEALREKLMELTEQMKSRWRESQRKSVQSASLPAVLPQRFNISDKEDVSGETRESQQNPALLLPVESQQLQESSALSLSEVSDATEIKSLSENPRNISSRTNESSKLWKQRLSEKDLEETVYRQLERPPASSLPTPLTDEVPVRETSRSDQLRKIVKDVLDRHKTDIDFIRNNLKDVDVPDAAPPGEGQEFQPKYPTILTTPPSLPEMESGPRPVPSDFNLVLSDETQESEKPPQWIDVTKDNSDLPEVTGPNNLSATVYKKLPMAEEQPAIGRSNDDRNTFMKTVVRKYEIPAPNNTSIPSDMAISEGVLSDMSIISSPPAAPRIDSQTYSKDDPDVIERVLRVEKPEVKTLSEELTDSESTLQGIDDLILQNSPRLQQDLIKIRKAVEKRKKKKQKEQKTVGSSSAVPDALHLRFLTELHQLETVNNTQRLLDELEQIKKSSFENHRGLEEVHLEMNNQRRLIEEQNNAEKLRKAQTELQDLYSSKLQTLLDNQNEVTKVTSDVARHLADIAGGKAEQNFSVVTELQKMIETMQRKQQQEVTSTQTSHPNSRSKSSGREVSTSYSRQESEKDETDGVVHTDIDSRTFSSKPPSSILELIEQNQAAGNSIQKTISEALASISESEKRTKSKSSNITEEVEEELSTDYSSHFEDESTLREKSFHAVLPSVSHQKCLMSSDASDTSDRELTLFSDSHSFSRLTVELVRQHMKEQAVRDQHKAAMLRAREKALIVKAKKKMEELDKLVDKGQDEKMPDIRKKKKAVLTKLKERRAEIAKMRENLKQAESERKFLLKEQQKHWGKQEEEEDPGETAESEKISRVEVLQGLKRLDKSRRFQTSKERRLSDRMEDKRVSDRMEDRSSLEVTENIPTSLSQSRLSKLSSGPESENESVRESTLSEHSDVEARIAALSQKLQTRMRTAARLKKEQKKKSKEKLRSQEVTLIKQIEKYDQLITEGLAEVSDISNESFSKPKIKSPVSSSKVERRTPSPRLKTPELASYSSVSFIDEEIRDSETVESPDVSNSTILASPSKVATPSPQKLLTSELSELIEERSSPVISSKSSSPVSKVKLIAEGKVPEILPQTPEKSRSSGGNQQTEYSSLFECEKAGNEKQDAGRRVTDKLVDSITENIWQQIIKETQTKFSPFSTKEESPVSPGKTVPPKPRQKVRSQQLTLAFDIGSSSEESSPGRVPEEEKSETEELGEGRESQEFLDDDFGLSTIRQEEEILRLEQARVEEEIAALQRESSLLSSVPDKPPPPYQPPPHSPVPSKPSLAPPKPERPPPPKKIVPQQPQELLPILQGFVSQIYEARQAGLALTTLSFSTDSVSVPDTFTEAEAEAVRKYHGMLFSVTLEKVMDMYEFENLEQNPPWMEQLPLARMRFSSPQSLEDLGARLHHQVFSDLKLMKKVERENLLVSWAGKKRDRVDEILVRELQEEEVVWTNYNKDEVSVKDQMTETLLEGLISDTALVFANIYKKLQNV